LDVKTLGTNAAAAWDTGEKKACAFVKLELDSGTQRYSTLPYDMSWNDGTGAATWIGTGSLAQISEMRESEGLIANGVQITLSGLPTSFVSIALSENIQGRVATIWFAALGSSNQVLDTPPVEFKGSIDFPPIGINGGQATIVVNVESRIADFARPRVRRYNDADQQAAYPGDLFFEFTPQMVAMTLVWPARSWFLR
jgi:hypothetical protein